MTLCRLPSPIVDAFASWSQTSGQAESARAVPPLFYILEELVGEYLSDGGRRVLRVLGENWKDLHDVISLTFRSEAKFYRDHLHHSMRVALLAGALSAELERMGLLLEGPGRKIALLSGLMHDLGSPLADGFEMLESLTTRLAACYETLTIPVVSKRHLVKPLVEWLPLLRLDRLVPRPHQTQLVEEWNHAICGALQVLSCLRREQIEAKPRPLITALQAVAVHDPNVQTTIRFASDPLAAILILADELQEWGRPVYAEKEPIICNPSFFDCSRGIKIKFDFSSVDRMGFSCLRQARDKLASFSRLQLDGGFPAFELVYSLGAYLSVRMSSVVTLLEGLWTSTGVGAKVIARRVPRNFAFHSLADIRGVDEARQTLELRLPDEDPLLCVFPARGEAIMVQSEFHEFCLTKTQSGSIVAKLRQRTDSDEQRGELCSLDTVINLGQVALQSTATMMMAYLLAPMLLLRIERVLLAKGTKLELQEYSAPQARPEILRRIARRQLGRNQLHDDEVQSLRLAAIFGRTVIPEHYFVFLPG